MRGDKRTASALVTVAPFGRGAVWLSGARGSWKLMSADQSGLVGVAAVTDILLRWLRRPDVEHLAGEELLSTLRDLRERIELELDRGRID